MKVEQLMQRDVKTCTADDTLEAAARIMWENDVGIVPVVDAQGRVIGIVTDRDICMASYTQGKPIREISMSAAWSNKIVSVLAGDDVDQAEEQMRKHQVRRLPVLDGGGKLLGMLSLNDLARRTGHRYDDLSTDEVARTLAAISMPMRRASA